MMTEARPSAYLLRSFALLAWLWLAVALPFLTDAACHLFVGVALAGGWIVLGVGWLLVPCMAPASLRTGSGRRSWLSAGAAGCLGLCLAFTDIGLILRIVRFETALAGYAAQVPPGGGDFQHVPRRVGLFGVDGEENHRGAVFLSTSQGFINREGVAYVPAAPCPPQVPRRHLRHLYGPWYGFYWRF